MQQAAHRSASFMKRILPLASAAAMASMSMSMMAPLRTTPYCFKVSASSRKNHATSNLLCRVSARQNTWIRMSI